MLGRRRMNHNYFPYHVYFPMNGNYSIGISGPNDMRQQPYMYNYPIPQWNGNPYYGQNFYPNQMYPQPMPNIYQQQPGLNQYLQGGSGQSNPASVFHNPLQPMEDGYYSENTNQMNHFLPANPYPKQSFIPKPPSGINSIMNSFKGQDGSLDVNKMVNTAGQMMNAVTQVSSMVKGLGGILKV